MDEHNNELETKECRENAYLNLNEHDVHEEQHRFITEKAKKPQLL